MDTENFDFIRTGTSEVYVNQIDPNGLTCRHDDNKDTENNDAEEAN